MFESKAWSMSKVTMTVLLIALITSGAAHGQDFSDGFESGNANGWEFDAGAGAHWEIAGDQTHSGDSALHLWVSEGEYYPTMVYRQLSGSFGVYEAWFYVGAGCRGVALAFGGSAEDTASYVVTCFPTGSSHAAELYIERRLDAVYDTLGTASPGVSCGEWFKIAVECAVDGGIRISTQVDGFDEQLQIDVQDSTYLVASLVQGGMAVGGQYDLYVDDVAYHNTAVLLPALSPLAVYVLIAVIIGTAWILWFKRRRRTLAV